MPPTERLVRRTWTTDADTLDAVPHDAPATDLTPGTRVGEYVVRELIASGGFGVVYRAEDPEGRPVAVKVLHAELAGTPEAVRRFEREIEAVRRVHHPNVVNVFAFGQIADGRPYFAMELLEGVDLEQHVRARGRLSPDEVLAIAEPLCAALDAAHEKNIIHRDFKASNVLLCEPGSARRVVLLDFGVAKLLDDAGPGLTTSRNMLGTPACMAPEQITGRPADARTDVYALGALTYFMLTGELPFRDASVIVMLHMHLYARPPCPSAVAPVSSAIDDVVTRAMSKDPAERYATAGAFAAALRAAVALLPSPRGEGSEVLERRAVGVHVEVIASSDDPDNPDDKLLTDVETILPTALDILCARGLSTVLQTGNTALFAAELPPDSASAQEVRRAAVLAALELSEELDQRPERDDRVHVNICLHEGSVDVADTGIVGGELVALASWVPKTAVTGVAGSAAALVGLGFSTEPLTPSGSLRRVLASAHA
jgi:serine/threonine-protein kinase